MSPIAYFITWTTYGSWLPGDARGWVKKRTWGVQRPDLQREEIAERRLEEDPVILTLEQRRLVDAVIVEHCALRGWILLARTARTNHVHVVLSGQAKAQRMREQLKLWSSHALSDTSSETRHRWWSEGGDIEYVWQEDELPGVIEYVTQRQ